MSRIPGLPTFYSARLPAPLFSLDSPSIRPQINLPYHPLNLNTIQLPFPWWRAAMFVADNRVTRILGVRASREGVYQPAARAVISMQGPLDHFQSYYVSVGSLLGDLLCTYVCRNTGRNAILLDHSRRPHKTKEPGPSLNDELSGEAILPAVMSQPGLYSRGALCRSSDKEHASRGRDPAMFFRAAALVDLRCPGAV